MQTVDNNWKSVKSFGSIFFAVANQSDTFNVMPDTATVNLWQNHDRAKIRIRMPQKSWQPYDSHDGFNPPPSMRIYRNCIDSSKLAPVLLSYPDHNWWKNSALSFSWLSTSTPYYYSFQITDSLLNYRWYNIADSSSVYDPLYYGQGSATIYIQNETSTSYSDAQVFFVLDKPWNTTVIKAVKTTMNNNTIFQIPNVPKYVTGKIVVWCVSSGKQLFSNYTVDVYGNGSFPDLAINADNVNYQIVYNNNLNLDDLSKHIKDLDAK